MGPAARDSSYCRQVSTSCWEDGDSIWMVCHSPPPPLPCNAALASQVLCAWEVRSLANGCLADQFWEAERRGTGDRTVPMYLAPWWVHWRTRSVLTLPGAERVCLFLGGGRDLSSWRMGRDPVTASLLIRLSTGSCSLHLPHCKESLFLPCPYISLPPHPLAPDPSLQSFQLKIFMASFVPTRPGMFCSPTWCIYSPF